MSPNSSISGATTTRRHHHAPLALQPQALTDSTTRPLRNALRSSRHHPQRNLSKNVRLPHIPNLPLTTPQSSNNPPTSPCPSWLAQNRSYTTGLSQITILNPPLDPSPTLASQCKHKSSSLTFTIAFIRATQALTHSHSRSFPDPARQIHTFAFQPGGVQPRRVCACNIIMQKLHTRWQTLQFVRFLRSSVGNRRASACTSKMCARRTVLAVCFCWMCLDRGGCSNPSRISLFCYVLGFGRLLLAQRLPCSISHLSLCGRRHSAFVDDLRNHRFLTHRTPPRDSGQPLIDTCLMHHMSAL